MLWTGSVGSRSGVPDLVLLTDREASTSQALPIALLLVVLDLAQHGTQSLVGHDCALRDSGSLVEEDAAPKRLVRMTGLDPSVFALVDAAAFAHERQRLGVRLQEVHHAPVLEGQIR